MKRFKNILLVFNESTQNKATIEQAKDLCKRNQARLTVVNVVEDVLRAGDQGPTPEVLSSLHSHDLEIRKQDLEQLVEPVRQEGIQVATKVITGTPFLQIIREVLRFKHDLVIMTADGNGGLRERVFCSTSMHLMRKSPCPVWVVKPDHSGHYARILAAVVTILTNKKTNWPSKLWIWPLLRLCAITLNYTLSTPGPCMGNLF